MADSLDSVLQQVNMETPASSGTSAAEIATRAPSFTNLTPTRNPSGKSFDHLYNVKLDAEAVLGRADLSVEDMLNLGVGSVLELDRLVSDPVDLVVQNVRVARGEVVVVNDQFAIRITEIISGKN